MHPEPKLEFAVNMQTLFHIAPIKEQLIVSVTYFLSTSEPLKGQPSKPIHCSSAHYLNKKDGNIVDDALQNVCWKLVLITVNTLESCNES